MFIGKLAPVQPYQFEQSARIIHRYHGVLDRYEAGVYRRALRIAEHLIPVRVEPDLRVYSTAPNPEIIPRLRRILAVDVDLNAFYALAETDARLWRVVKPLVGVRHFQTETIFEALLTVIMEQQISLVAALRAQRELALWANATASMDDKTLYAFPTREQITAADPEALQARLKITHRRVALMQRCATLDLEHIRQLPAEDAYNELIQIKGVGHWTAAWTLLRGASCYAFAGHNDVALRDAVAHYFFDTSERVSAAVVDEVFQKYTPYAGAAAFYTLTSWALEHY